MQPFLITDIIDIVFMIMICSTCNILRFDAKSGDEIVVVKKTNTFLPFSVNFEYTYVRHVLRISLCTSFEYLNRSVLSSFCLTASLELIWLAMTCASLAF